VSGDLPLVSVVVPARNAEQTIGDCLASVLSGEYPSHRREVLVVDNGSTDGTAEIAAAYHVGCVREPRRGPSQARNRGIEASSGDVVAFVDADCLAASGWLAELVRPFEDGAVDGVAGELVPAPASTAAQRYRARQHVAQKDYISRSRPFAATGNVAFRREVFDAIGVFDPDLFAAEDQDFGWRFFAAGLRLAYSERAVVFVRHRRTRWGLFKQQVSWGYGHARLQRKYDLPWGLRPELRKQTELAASAAALVGDGLRYALHGQDGVDLGLRSCELVQQLGRRVGSVYGLLEGLVQPRRRGGARS
jgi:glycosyltransferase involved in cell wall biosynthesis